MISGSESLEVSFAGFVLHLRYTKSDKRDRRFSVKLQKRPFERFSHNLALYDSIAAGYIKNSEYSRPKLKLVSIKSMNLFTLLDEECVLPDVEVENKEQAINALVNALQNKVDPKVLERIREKVFERESVMSTGVGKGLAIPHCKTKSVDENYAAFAILKEPLDFKSIDGEPVRILFLLVGPEDRHSQHIKLLSRISRLMNSNSFHEKLLNSHTSEAILEAFKQEEQNYFAS